MVESYHKVAKNLVEIGGWSTKRKAGELVEQVAKSKDGEFIMDTTPMVGLVVYGYDGAQKAKWKNDLTKLEEAHMPVQYHGEAKKIRLHGAGKTKKVRSVGAGR